MEFHQGCWVPDGQGLIHCVKTEGFNSGLCQYGALTDKMYGRFFILLTEATLNVTQGGG